MNRHQRRAAARQSDTRIAIQFVSGLELLERAARREDLAGTVVAFYAAMVSTRQPQCVLCPTQRWPGWEVAFSREADTGPAKRLATALLDHRPAQVDCGPLRLDRDLWSRSETLRGRGNQQ